ncbi:MAG TPA: PQQ-dependent sugar dehydrogenase [Flavobacteriales bacterium]
MRNVLITLALALSGSAHAQTAPPVTLDLVPWATGIPYITDIADCGDGRLFVVQQGGAIRIVSDSMTVLPTPFLNIFSQVHFSGEQGLLGLVFDPDYATNGHFYVNYTTPPAAGHNTIIARFTVSDSNPNVADPTSQVVLLTIPQPGVIHKAGDLEFGPDGMLYLSIGDGGPQGDPANSGQRMDTQLGKLLRIEVQEDGTWTVPPDNPFVGAVSDTLPEIWAFGARNPFRFGIDPLNGDLWFGDVGHQGFEEVNRLPGDTSGVNFGWRCYEGFQAYALEGCPADSLLEFPMITHANILNGGTFCAVIGGKVYRGSRFPRLYGRYLYTDYCSGEFRSFLPDGQGGWLNEQLRAAGQFGFSCLVTDGAGELFTGNRGQQMVYKVVDRCPMDAPVLSDLGGALFVDAGVGFTWLHDGDTLHDVTGPELVGPVSGSYQVVVDMGNGCLFTTDTVEVVSTGVPTWRAPVVQVRPDPASDRVMLTWPKNLPALRIELLDLFGRVVRRWPGGADGSAELFVGDLPSGRYVVRLNTAAGWSSAALGVVR